MRQLYNSLKYRIAVIIFVLEAVMMILVLGITLNHTRESNLQQLNVSENVVTNLLGMLSRVALFTEEYADLQPYVKEMVTDPHVVQVVIADQDNRIVVSSKSDTVGRFMPELINDDDRFWRTQEISNASGLLGKVAINFSHVHLTEVNREALDMGMVIAISGMSIIAVVGLLIGFLMTRNLQKLTDAARRMAQGELNVYSGISGSDEFAVLGQAFDHMAASIKSHVHELRQSQDALRHAHDELEQRIRERTRELAIASDRAFEASRVKSAFLANMSHELRTPLNAIIGYADILSEEAADQGFDHVLPDMKHIRDAGSHLLSLINDILDLSKIEAGKVEFHIAETDVNHLIRSAVSTVQPLIVKNQNKLCLEIPEDIGAMHVDELKLRQCLLNLLGNAAKFTHRGTITIRVSSSSDAIRQWVNIDVVDTGIGIPEEKLDRLFMEFSQVDNSHTRSYQGSGLGLTISKKLCVMMGGDIQVDTELGVGSTFTIHLPRDVIDPKQYVPVESVLNRFQPEIVRRQQLSIAETPERRSRVATILVIDDDRHMVNILDRMLSRDGFEVVSADCGEQGIMKARKLLPDVIVLDVLLPDTDGWSVLKMIKSDVAISHIPVVILTMSEGAEIGFSLGASHFMHKPLDRDMMLELLRECVRKS